MARMTYNTAVVLLSLAGGPKHGFDLVAELGLSSGTIYPILRRLEERRLVVSEWEDEQAAHAEGRPRRRYYDLTSNGEAAVGEAVERFERHQKAFARLLPGRGRSDRP